MYSPDMGDRYSQMDLNLYGAEDDLEMDGILRALDGALGSDTTAGDTTERTGEWKRLLSAPTFAVRVLNPAELPEGPGVYLWSRDGQPTYVGTAKSLRQRVSKHLGGGVSLAGSSLRRNVCELLFHIPPRETSNRIRRKVTIEQVTAIREWLRDCTLSWVETSSDSEASVLESELRRTFLPPLNRV